VPAVTLERVFTLIEMNAASVPVFRKFVAGEPLDAGDVAELAKAARELGVFEFAELVAKSTPDVVMAIAQAHDVFDRADKVRQLWGAFLR
jgi:hypothetical protein